MTPKERVAIALEHYTPDRVPSDFNLGGKVMIRHKGRKQIKIGFIGAGHPHSGQYMPFGMLVSDDAAAYISPGFYKEFAIPYVERLSSEFGGINFHCCMGHAHNLENYVSVKGFLGVCPKIPF